MPECSLAICGAPAAAQRCPCLGAFFCDAACQRAAWAAHKSACAAARDSPAVMRARGLLVSALTLAPKLAIDAAWLADTLTSAEPAAAIAASEALARRALRGENVDAELFDCIVAAAVAAARDSAQSPLLARTLHLLEVLISSNVARVDRLLSANGVQALMQSLKAHTRDKLVMRCALSVIGNAVSPGLKPVLRSDLREDTLVGAGALSFLAAAMRDNGRSTRLIYVAACTVRNLTTGSEARKDAAVAAGVVDALSAVLMELVPGATDEEPIMTYADGHMVDLPLPRNVGCEDGWDVAMDALGSAVATLSSPSDADGVVPGAPGYDFAPVDARNAHLLKTAPSLVQAFYMNAKLPGIVLALRNIAGIPGAPRAAVRSAALQGGRPFATKLFTALFPSRNVRLED